MRKYFKYVQPAFFKQVQTGKTEVSTPSQKPCWAKDVARFCLRRAWAVELRWSPLKGDVLKSFQINFFIKNHITCLKQNHRTSREIYLVTVSITCHGSHEGLGVEENRRHVLHSNACQERGIALTTSCMHLLHSNIKWSFFFKTVNSYRCRLQGFFGFLIFKYKALKSQGAFSNRWHSRPGKTCFRRHFSEKATPRTTPLTTLTTHGLPLQVLPWPVGWSEPRSGQTLRWLFVLWSAKSLSERFHF